MATFELNKPAFARNESLRLEAQILGLEVEGRLPSTLQGTFYRLTPDPLLPSAARHHLLEGGGVITALHFRDGQVDFLSRYLETVRFEHDRTTRGSGTFRRPRGADASGADAFPRAKTALRALAGKLYVIGEDGAPDEIDVRALETRGNHDALGRLKSYTLTSHPKTDPVTGEVLTYAAVSSGESTSDLTYYVLDGSGSVKHEAWLPTPYGGLVHDFAVTPDWSLFPVFPVAQSIERRKAKVPIWEPERGTHLGVLPRYGETSELRWFHTDPCFALHILNAFQEGDLVHIDLMEAETLPLPFPGSLGAMFDPRAVPRLTRWTIDLADTSNRIHRTRLCQHFAEMPTCDPRWVGKRYCHAFMGIDDGQGARAHGPGESLVCYGSLGHWNHRRSFMRLWHCEAGSAVQGPLFVPRSPTSPEGDGFLLAVVNRYAEKRSDVVVLDTIDITAGPIATIALPIRLKNQVLGTWLSAADGG